MRISNCIFFAALLSLSGCGSSPKTQFFTLGVVPAPAQKSVLPVPVQLTVVHLPPSLDRRQIVNGTANSTDAVTISATKRWTAPLGDLTRNVLARDLAARAKSGSIILPDAPAPPDTHTLVVTLTKFGSAAGNTVTMEGSWTLMTADGKTVLRKPIALQVAGRGKSLANAMSILLGRLSAEITSTMANATDLDTPT